MIPQLTPDDLRPDQVEDIRHALASEYYALNHDVGLGKTAIALTIAMERIARLQTPQCLVVAPKRVARLVWRQEAEKWSHTRALKIILIEGNPKQRYYLLRQPADIHLINYELLPWLVNKLIERWLERHEYPPWRMIILDEIDKLKDPTSLRSRALQRVLPYLPFRLGMTGTPASEGYKDLFGQYLVLDGGARLGTSITTYLETWFWKDGYQWRIRPGAAEQIKQRVADITTQRSKRFTAEPIINIISVELPPEARKAYTQLEKEMFAELDGGEEIDVANNASLVNKCLQFAAGHPYITPNSEEYAVVHDAKLDALEDLIDESAGQSILLAYQFRSDWDRIKKRFPYAEQFGSGKSELEDTDLQRRWNNGEVRLLCAHPASAGHGLNLQSGGHILVWFGLTWSRRLYLQMVGRTDRQGQQEQVVIHKILAVDTADELQQMALNYKEGEELDFKTTINQYRGKR